MPRLKATSRSACSESFGKMYVLAVNPSPRNPMGSISDDWVSGRLRGSIFGCIMSIVTQSTSAKMERQVVFFVLRSRHQKDFALYPFGLL